MTTHNASIALYSLFRLAPIAVEVVRRHAGNAVVASFEGTLVPAVDAFIAAYSTVSSLKARLAASLDESAAATAALFRGTSAWLGPVVRDLPDFEGRGFGVNSTVDEDVQADARRLLDVVRTEGQSMTYGPQLIEEITRLYEAAQAAHARAQAMRVALQAQQAETRTFANQLQRELVALRRTLRAELGASHVDYQRLRAPRGRAEVDEATDEAEVPVG